MNLSGVVVRLGPGKTLPPGRPRHRLRRRHSPRFVRDSFEEDALKGLPGLDSTGPGGTRLGRGFLAGSGRMPWLAWRSKRVAELYATLAATVRQTSPGSSWPS
ncbi:MAG: hypothetical protein U0835_03590 [Isosphaeraceae bacterium]